MFKSLFLMGSVVSMIGAVPSVNIDNNSTSEKIEYGVTYPYETNEVNSYSDIHIGNIYKLTLTETINTPFVDGDRSVLKLLSYSFVNYLENYKSITFSNVDNIQFNPTFLEVDFLEIYIRQEDNSFSLDCDTLSDEAFSFSFNFLTFNDTEIYLYVVPVSLIEEDIRWEQFSASDYLGEPIVTETEITGFYNVVYEWFDDYIFGVDALQSFEITLFGSTITLASYLSMISTIITLVILIITLFILIRWVFRSFSGLIR